jgi:O-antigen chain-terminating methyltransferase
MVEHLPFDVLITLIDEALRVLKPEGIIVFETPNPSNIFVGATTFHLDPTHRKPLPSAMLRFFVEARGFCDVHVRELHPYPEAMRLPDDPLGISQRFNQYFYGPQDYAVIGKKP